MVCRPPLPRRLSKKGRSGDQDKAGYPSASESDDDRTYCSEGGEQRA